MRPFRKPLILSCLVVCGAALASAQNEIQIEPATGGLGWLTRPYQARYVPPIRLNNSPRLETLLRAGNLYLTAPDAVALAVENNPDVELQRYGPLLAQEVLKRAQSGGALRSVGLPLSQGPQSVSLQGVSTNSGGGVGLSAGSGVSSGGGIVTQLGPQIPSLDPTVFFFANFAHSTTPQSNTFLTGTTSLVANTRAYQAQYAQNWAFGLNAALTYASQYTSLNSQFFSLNPYTSGFLDLQLTQNLLQGFGSAVNGRNIRVQKNNLKVTDLQFKQQVILTVSSVLNLYWDLVAFDEDVRARQQELTTARQLLDDNKKQVEIGALAEIEVTRAEAQLYAAQQDLVIAQTNRMQQETVLKNALSRNGITAAGLAAVHIVPLDNISVPATDETRPTEDLIGEALGNRAEIEQAKINIDSNKLNLVGIKNSLRPTLQAFAELTNNGLTGDLTPLGAQQPSAYYFAGGYGNMRGTDLPPQLPELFGRILAQRPNSQSSGAVGLRHQHARASPERVESAERTSIRCGWTWKTRSSACNRRGRVTRRPSSPANCSSRHSMRTRSGTGSARPRPSRLFRTSVTLRRHRALKCRPWRTSRTRASPSTRPSARRWT